MDIKLRVKTGSFAELRIETHNVTITDDLTVYENRKWSVPDVTIESFINIARDCNSFNGSTDVEFVKKIYEAFLNDYERGEFLREVIEGGDNE